MPASLVHLVRHGEVYNPDHVLYGRIPGYGLSELGMRMAKASADSMVGRPIVRLVASPLQRTQESAAPWSVDFGLPIETDERLIEPWNDFEGTRGLGGRTLLNPRVWPRLRNPFQPSWGEPYAQIVARMMAAVEDAWNSVDDGEVVLVSHQLPIWMVHRHLAGERLFHDPRKRRCALSSITTISVPEPVALRQAQEPGPTPANLISTGSLSGVSFAEVDYQDPAAPLQASAIDQGAV